jgi:polyisoprenoid-binding protein YceI
MDRSRPASLAHAAATHKIDFPLYQSKNLNTKSNSLRFIASSLFTLGVVSAGVTHAQQKLIPAQSEITFTSKQMGVPVDGKFKRFEAQMNFDPKKPETSKVNFTVDLLSVDIGNTETERELTKPGWFDSAKVPAATFSSGAIKSVGAAKYEVSGKLVIKGQSRDVVVPITLAQSAGTTTARGEFTIKRLEFKIGDGDWNDLSLVANEVIVKVKLAVTGMAPL